MMSRYLNHRIAIVSCWLLTLTACGVTVERQDGDGAPRQKIDVASIPDAVPRVEPRSRYGNPKSYVVFGKRYYVMDSSKGFVQRGIASWYGTKFHGRRTSSGETYDMYKMTAAHKSLPLPTYVQVKNLENGKNVIVRVNDRGPFHDGRVIDLSYTAATKLGIVKNGTGRVEVRAIDPATYANRNTGTTSTVKTIDDSIGIYIQVGTFSDLRNAQNLQIKLSDVSSHLVTIKQVVVNDNTLYRVIVGPIFHIDIADKVQARLEQLGIQDHRIITN